MRHRGAVAIGVRLGAFIGSLTAQAARETERRSHRMQEDRALPAGGGAGRGHEGRVSGVGAQTTSGPGSAVSSVVSRVNAFAGLCKQMDKHPDHMHYRI
jgi:hypothetical protein